MHPIKVQRGGRGSWTLVAFGVCGLTALIVAGCGSAAGPLPGTGGASAGTGGNNAGTGGASSGTGGASSGTGGTTVGTGGATAGTGGSTVGTGGTAAGTGGSTAGTGGASTATGGNAAGTGGRGAATGGATAATGGRGGAGTGGMGAATGGATGQGGRGVLTLSSTSLINSGTFMAANTCAGANQSPPFTWTAGPAGTQSYAIVLLDTANTRYHWAIWNIPASVLALPAALPAGATISTPVSAMQAITGAGTPSYQGPCPSGATHLYVFTVYALDVAMLPGLGGGAMAQPVSAALQSHVLASGTLSGSSNASRP